MISTLGSWLAELVSRRPGRLLLAAALLTTAAALPASRLRFDTDLPSLLPPGGPAVRGYRAPRREDEGVSAPEPESAR